MSELNIFHKVHFSKAVEAGNLVWCLGKVEEAYAERIYLDTEELRQLFDVIGAELESQYSDGSEVKRLQEEALQSRVEYKRLQASVALARKALHPKQGYTDDHEPVILK